MAEKKFVIVEVDPEQPVVRLGAALAELEGAPKPERIRKVVPVLATPSGAGWKVRYADADGKFETGVEEWTPVVFDTRKQANESLRLDNELSLEREVPTEPDPGA